MSRLRTYLQLGRVSNLPTVWTNAVAGAALAVWPVAPGALAWLAAAFSLFYVGGMFLNDAFDREVDARQRPERPIPSGRVSAAEVLGVGFALLAGGTAMIAARGVAPLVSGLALAAAIVLYNVWHKGNPLSPLLMGACRVLIYAGAALSVGGRLEGRVVWAMAALLSYLIGLTFIAKQENLTEVRNLWPLLFLATPLALSMTVTVTLRDPFTAALWVALGLWCARALRLLRTRKPGAIPRAVAELIAGICLVDALLLGWAGLPTLGLVVAAGLPVTLFFQRYVAGT